MAPCGMGLARLVTGLPASTMGKARGGPEEGQKDAGDSAPAGGDSGAGKKRRKALQAAASETDVQLLRLPNELLPVGS